MKHFALSILASAFFAQSVSAQACREDTVYLRGDWGQARFTVEIADEPNERAQGLMHRTELGLGQGMLFQFTRPRALTFWMRNTLIELDLIFLDPKGIVKTVHHRAQPLDETPIPGGRGLVAVLEINGGLSERLGIVEGSQMRHPFFGSDAAWACE